MIWQPIDTAPKDGTEILAVDGDVYAVVRWCAFAEPPQWRDHAGLGAGGIDPFEPTHWMPLPEAPK